MGSADMILIVIRIVDVNRAMIMINFSVVYKGRMSEIISAVLEVAEGAVSTRGFSCEKPE